MKSQHSRSCVLVLGMHRSGTSALGGVLSKLGCDMPATPMPASKNNAKGFFESVVVRDFNEELLASAGSSWDDFTPFHEGWLETPNAREFLDRSQDVLKGEFGASSLFVLKDPRICRLVPFWTEALTRFGCSIKPILTLRNPLEVSHSLHSKKGYSEPLGQMIWLRHALDAERDTRGMVRFHTSFQELMQGWELVAQKAQDSLQLVWPKRFDKIEIDVAHFLSSDLKHHQEPSARAVQSSLLPEWLRETFEILNGWAKTGEVDADHQRLDRIKAEFDVASLAFGRLVGAERHSLAEHKQKLEQLLAEKAQIAQDLLAVRSQVAGASADSERQRAALESLEKQRVREREALEGKLAEVTHDLERQRTTFDNRLVEIEEKHRTDREGLNARLAVAIADAERQRAELKEALKQERLTAKKRELLRADVVRLEEQVAALGHKLEEQDQRHADECARLEARIAEEVAEGERQQAEAERHLLTLDQLKNQHVAELDQLKHNHDTELEALHERLEATAAEAGQRRVEIEEQARRASEDAQTIVGLKQALQAERRRATLLEAELHQTGEAQEALRLEIEKMKVELAASRARRKEAAALIAKREAEIRARYQELGALQRYMMDASPFLRAKALWGRAGRSIRRAMRKRTGSSAKAAA